MADLRRARPLEAGDHAGLARPVSQRALEDAYVTNALMDAHDDDPELGYRFLADGLERVGLSVGERRVWRAVLAAEAGA